MNILYIAYSCSPVNGSEDKIGWNIPVESSKTNQVFVLTKEEQRKPIEQYLRKNKIDNICFSYVDIPEVYKKVFRGPFYSGRLNVWNRRALKAAKEICFRENIDIIHQIAPVEFRSIGDYGRIPGVKFVCGPIAGGQVVPKGLKDYTKKYRVVELVRSLVNRWYQFTCKVTGKLNSCDYLLFANLETREYLAGKHLQHVKCSTLTDVSIDKMDFSKFEDRSVKDKGKCRFLVVGRLVYLKGHSFLLDALARLPAELDYECRIVGEGPELERLKMKCKQKALEHRVSFVGAVPYCEIENVYKEADVLIMPSFREATGSVVLEAMAAGLPVVTINRFGGAAILDNDTGWLYDGKTKEEYLENLKDALVSCITQPNEVLRRGENCRRKAQNYTWEERVKYYQTIYKNL